jgi:hypothetical protein
MEVILTTVASWFKPDERFIMHRYHSTRVAMIVGIILIVGWFNYDLLVHHHVRWGLAIIAGAMAVGKLLVMAYLRVAH